MVDFKDVQGMKPDSAISVNRAGVKGVKIPVDIHRGKMSFHLVCLLDLFVNLPDTRKGADMSRAIESITTSARDRGELVSLESFCGIIGVEALKRFDYSEKVQIRLRTELPLTRQSHQGRESTVFYPVEVFHRYTRDGHSLTTITSEILIMNACPCAMETTRELLKQRFGMVQGLPDAYPSVTHNQRNKIRVSLTSSLDPNIDLIDIIETVEESMGGPLLSLLKRVDEGEHVLDAHLKPMFVEDLVRLIAIRIGEKFDKLSKDVLIKISSESEESIHPHNAYAEIETTLDALRHHVQ